MKEPLAARRKAAVVTVESRVERKDPRLPRFLVVPGADLARWNLAGTTVVEAAVNGVKVGRRSLKQWDQDRWFVELSEPMCRRAAVDTGDRVALALRRASEALPAELAALVARNSRARAAWTRLTPARQRLLREEVLAAKQPETRRRRAARGLGVSGSR